METAPLAATQPTPRPAERAAQAAEAPPSATASADFNSFLRLLTAQLENQDPLEPLDSTQFVAQLASFSTVEQLIGVNEKIEGLAAQDSDVRDPAALASWIGLEVGAPGGAFAAGGGPLTFAAPGRADADAGVLTISRADGTLLRQIPFDPDGPARIAWDGRDAAGATVTGKDLTAEAIYTSGGVPTGRAGTEVLRTVTGLTLADGTADLRLSDGTTTAPEDVALVQRAPTGG